MPSSNTKGAAAAKDKPRKSSANKPTKIVLLKVSPERLRAILDPTHVNEDTPMKDVKASPDSTPTAAPAASNPDNVASDSNPATPGANGTPALSVMGPPEKKKGVKRSAAAANGEAKAKGKPGPKKRQRLEDGTLEPVRGNTHRLGPKANQGAINAGLRALDRSGKPCRKWNRGGFRLKTFTGVEWEISRWTAPPRPKPVEITEVTPEGVDASAVVSTAGSSKENGIKEEGGLTAPKSDISNSGGDVEMQSAPSLMASSPAPMPVAAGA